MAQFTDEQLQRKIQEGFIVESEADMTPPLDTNIKNSRPSPFFVRVF